MVTVHRQAAWKIAVYGREHGVPHFHVEGPDFRCSVTDRNAEVIVGYAPARVLAEARNWAEANERELAATWRELNR